LDIIIPNSVIGAVSSIIAADYVTHSKLNALFMESGAPGEIPDGSREKKSTTWLIRCNEDSDIDAIQVLGQVIQNFMDRESPSLGFRGAQVETTLNEGRDRIVHSLAKHNLTYKTNGFVIKSGSTVVSKTLEDYLKSGDFSSIEAEFDRALQNINTDHHASITASCSIIEAVLKHYIEHYSLAMPPKMNIGPLWQTVRQDLALNANTQLNDDQKKILTGITSIIDGVGAFRSHIGSAHGRGRTPPQITSYEARLAVNISHSLVTFIMDHLSR
jgi:hypothetical protein